MQQERGGGNEKNANLAVEILHLASLMRDQGDQGERPALTSEGNSYLLRENKIARRRQEPGEEECRPGTYVKDCLVEQRGEVGKECNIGLRNEEMRRGVKKKITTQQQGFLIQFSLLLCSVI